MIIRKRGSTTLFLKNVYAHPDFYLWLTGKRNICGSQVHSENLINFVYTEQFIL